MDTLTQGIIGGALFTLITNKQGRKPFLLGAVVTNLPDFDIFFSDVFFTDPIDQFFAHRGITHTFIGGVIIGLISAFIIYYLRKKNTSFRKVLGAAIVSIFLGHLCIDGLTTYGMRRLLPRSGVTSSLDSIFIIDFGMRFILFTGFITYLISNITNKHHVARGILIAAFSYFLLAGAIKWQGTKQLEAKFIQDYPGASIESMITIPEPFQPFLRRGIIKARIGTGITFVQGRWSLFDPRPNPTSERVITPDGIPYSTVRASLDDKRAAQFDKIVSFARGYLVIHAETDANTYRAESLLFGSIPVSKEVTPSPMFQFMITPHLITRGGDMHNLSSERRDGLWKRVF